MTKILINGREVEVDPAKPLIHALHGNDANVPMYCYHPGLTPVGSCRICQVEVQQGDTPPRVVVACRTPVAEGMRVFPDSDKAREVRRECLEFLLKNHPLDCPICDKAGECDLQDYAFEEGQSEGRTVEPRRKLEKRKSLGDVIVLDEERCILCSRCVRFMDEIPKTPQLTVAGLGSHSVISTFMDRPLSGNYQGNLADVCPVGALTTKPFRFQARVWNLVKSPGTCGECSRGCSVTNETLRVGELKRIRPRYNPEVNDWWMCDRGRFAIERHTRVNRLQGGLVRGGRGLEPVEVADALERAAGVFATQGPTLVVASPWITVEEGERLLALARELGAEATFVSPPPNGLADDILHTGDPCPNRRGLTELGFAPVEAAALLERLATAESALLVGERVVELLGTDGLMELPASLRLVVLDLFALEAPANKVSIGVPSSLERTGTWINVDGVRGRLGIARPPGGVAPLTETLDLLRAKLRETTRAHAKIATGGAR